MNPLQVGDGFDLGAGIDIDDLDGVAVRDVEEARLDVQRHIVPAAFSADDDFFEKVIAGGLRLLDRRQAETD